MTRRLDPTIPRAMSRAGAPAALPPRVGWLERRGSVLDLVDELGNRWPWPDFTLQVGAWGYREDGVAVMPRDHQVDATGAVRVEGDKVLIQFIDGSSRRPIVTGSIAPVGRVADLLVGPDASPNRVVAILRCLDANGEETGRVRLAVADDRKSPTVDLHADDDITVSSPTRVELILVDGNGNPSRTLALTSSGITAKGTGAASPVCTDALLTRLAGMMGDLATAVVAIPYTLPPTFVQDIAALAAKSDATTVFKGE
jgi:hypothetical protein